MQGEHVTTHRRDRPRSVARHRHPACSSSGERRVLDADRRHRPRRRREHDRPLRVIFFGFSIVVILLGAATTQLLVTSTFAPLRDVERTAARFAAGDYSQRLGGATPNTEVGRLNRSLNTMLARIDRAFADRQRTVDQMRRFVGDASHELRTPLVSLRGYAELYRMGALRSRKTSRRRWTASSARRSAWAGSSRTCSSSPASTRPSRSQLAPVDLLPIAQDAALDAVGVGAGRTITVVVPEPETDDADPAPSPSRAGADAGPRPPHAPPSTSTMTGPIAFAGATLARLRRRRPRGTPAPPVSAAARAAARGRADRARRGEQDPAGRHQPHRQRDAVHPRRQPDRARRRGRPRRRLRRDLDRRPRRGHPAAAAGEDLPALLAGRHLAHPRHRRQRASASRSSRASSRTTTATSRCSRRRAAARPSGSAFRSSRREDDDEQSPDAAAAPATERASFLAWPP